MLCLYFLLCYSSCEQVPGCTVDCCYLLLHLPAAANLYIVVSQDVVTVAVQDVVTVAVGCT